MTALTARAPSLNGTAEQAFPLDSYREAARFMRRPFTAAAVKQKVQATWPKENPANALVVCYMDARLVVDRLNLLLAEKWSDEYEQIDNTHMICRLTVDGVTRRDLGEGSGKALYSDALKRAAVKFGVGVSLYAVPKMILKGQHVKPVQTNKGKSLALTSDGEHLVRGLYEKWLEDHGSEAFGVPLDHGDVEDAQGDYEAEAAVEAPQARTVAPTSERLLSDDERVKVLQAVTAAGKDIDVMLGAFAVEATDDLSNAHAFEIRQWLDGKKEL